MYDDVAPLTDEEKKLYENIEFDLDEYCKDVGVGQLLHDSKAGNWCFHHSKIEISGKLHSNPSSFKLYCSCLPVGTNPNAPLEIPISFSSWDWGSFCRNWSQDCDPPQGHWQILHPPRPWHGPQSCGEAGRPWDIFTLIFFFLTLTFVLNLMTLHEWLTHSVTLSWKEYCFSNKNLPSKTELQILNLFNVWSIRLEDKSLNDVVILSIIRTIVYI